MPSARIHEVVAKKINREYDMDEILLRLGTIAPDCWRNVDASTGINSKEVSHFWNFKIKQGEANNYVEFFLKYYNEMNNPFYFGYLIHLITDQYWKSTIDPMYSMNNKWKLKDGSVWDTINDHIYFNEEENKWKEKEDSSKQYGKHFGYFEELKMQKKLAIKYNLGTLPIHKDDIKGFNVNIDELCLDGLFGEKGTANFVNGSLNSKIADNDSIVYDFDKYEKHIEDTVLFVKQELIKLNQLKELEDGKIKIAVDIDDTILRTKELEEYYWNKFLQDNPDISSEQEYSWGNPVLIKFWSEYREKMAFGSVKENASEAMNKLISNGYRVDLLSARPLDKYAHLKHKMVEYFESIGIKYDFLHLGFRSKKEFLKEHNYNVLIDNELKNVLEAESVGIISILYGNNPNYKGYQTDNWNEIPHLIEEITNKKSIGRNL